MKKRGVLIACLALGMTITVSAFTHKAISANMKSQAITYKGNNTYIGESKAKSIALQHAGLEENNVAITKLKLDRDDNRYDYEVEFFTENKEYDYEIDAITGKIISYDFDIEGFEMPDINNNTSDIGKEKAEQIALEHAGLTKEQVKYIQIELDKDNGRWEYQIEFRDGHKEYEYDINAYTGEIIDYSVDHD